MNLPSSELGFCPQDESRTQGRNRERIKINDIVFNPLTSNGYFLLFALTTGGTDSVKNASSAIYRKSVMLTYVTAQVVTHIALKMLKVTALNTLEVEMVTARAFFTYILIHSAVSYLVLELANVSALAKNRKISVYRAFAAQASVYRDTNLVNAIMRVGVSAEEVLKLAFSLCFIFS